MSDSRSTAKNNLLDDMLGDFLDESDQLIAQLNENLLQLDEWVQTLGADHHERCEENLLNEMFRAAHSLKGLSGMLGLSDINQLTHKIENVFDAASQDQLTFTRDVTDLIFMGVDQLVAMVGLLKEPGGEPVDCDAVLESIRRILQKAGAERKLGTQADAQQAFDAGLGDVWRRHRSTAPRTLRTPNTSHSDTVSVHSLADPLEDSKTTSNIPQKYLSMFVDEADASLEGLSSGLLALEGGHGRECAPTPPRDRAQGQRLSRVRGLESPRQAGTLHGGLAGRSRVVRRDARSSRSRRVTQVHRRAAAAHRGLEKWRRPARSAGAVGQLRCCAARGRGLAAAGTNVCRSRDVPARPDVRHAESSIDLRKAYQVG